MDVVLRGYLKCKAKGAWPKTWTKLWFILRHKSDGSKQLEYYENEKKSTVTNAVPKGIIDLSNVMLIQRLPEPDKKSQFMLTFAGMVPYRHFDAPSAYNMEEWVTSLNSIIFSKIIGDVVFPVDLHKNDTIPFFGPCEMKLEDETITVRNRVTTRIPHQQQFQWSIAHVKKFWVKSDIHQLVIMVGRQSSTGPGEFVFTTAQSMQIMHGITAMLNEAKRKMGLNMPLTAPASVETHTMGRPISTDRARSAKVRAQSTVSDKQQRMSTLPASHVYNKTEFRSTTSDSSYNVLRHHSDTGNKLGVTSQPYDMLDSSESKRSSVSSVHLSTHASPRTSPSGNRKSSYDSLHKFGDSISEEVYEDFSLDQPDGGGYGKLDHANRPPEIPSKKTSSEYGRLSQAMPFDPSAQQSEYGKLDHGSRPPALPVKRNVIQENEYGKLDHTGRTPEVPQRKPIVQENEYGKLDHSRQHETAQEPENQYGKLEHADHPPDLPPRRTIMQENEYGKLEHSKRYVRTPEPQVNVAPDLPQRNVVQENEYGKLEHSKQYVRTPEPQINVAPDLPQRNSVQENEYGKLEHSSHGDTFGVTSSSQQSEYSSIMPEGKGNYKQSSQQDVSIMQQNNYQNQGESFLSAQQSESRHKPQIPQRKSLQEHPSHSGKAENTFNLQPGDIPSGYATFKREHGYSISSSVTYDSDQDDQPADQSDKQSGSDGDTEYYSQLSLITDNANSSIQALNIQPNPSYSPRKPQPKPRNF